ncbi:phospholipase D-like domain-containing protein [Agromyces sp. SYSU T00266]|uniref:phospholipase D-like domain-containing protein n=1 Tax=Agromyces zhanjiangensis TaxID=3158562 RepID=UPI003393B9D9
MRTSDSRDGLTARAIAGNHVVLLAFSMERADIEALQVLGFAIRRSRHSDGDVRWMTGMKTFASVEPDPPPGVGRSSRRHPFQTFQWADYSVEANARYTYRVVAMTGAPGALVPGPTVELAVTTEPVDLGRHAVFFNRGAIASQEYARRFQNRRPDDVGPAAFDWLSRGLVEGLEAFIAQAGAGDALHGAFFEFKNPRVYAALRDAITRGATVKVLYDGDTQKVGNEAALAGSGLDGVVAARERSGRFAHNKFFVLSRAGVPSEVWTGSTNLSPNGLFGHSNNAHIVRDPAVAATYADYWALLERDVTRKPTAIEATAMTPAPAPVGPTDTTVVLSPRLDLDALDWYAELAGAATGALFTTFAFGMDDRFVEVYDQTDDVLRFALMERKGNGAKFAQQAATIDRIRRRPNTTVAVGARIELNAFDRWLAETDRATEEAHVLYIHTKYLLIDPLGADPVVVVGSANFSKASTDTNDENMLVIRGIQAVADVYLGEFMRLFSHYAFRESLKFRGATSPAEAFDRKHLVESTAWADAGYFRPGTDRFLRRRYFAGV